MIKRIGIVAGAIGLAIFGTLGYTNASTTTPLNERVMYNTWWKNAAEIPASSDISALGGTVPGQTLPPAPGRVLRIGQSVSDYWMDIGDIEAKFMTPAQGREWLIEHQAAGLGWGTIYTSAGELSQVQTALSGLHYFLWVANMTGVAHNYPGADITQWGNSTDGHVQESSVANPFWLIVYK